MSADWIPNNSDDICEEKGESCSIADMVAQTASQFVSEQLLPGYVYYQEYGAYYNKESGYFYDPSSTLFFHPSTQCYYSYNEQTTQYEVYPTTGAVETAEETVNGNGDNRSKWSRKNFKKRAEYLLGSQFVKTAVQEDVDVAELALELVDRCSFLAGDYCSKRTQKRGLAQEKHQQLDEDEPTTIGFFTKLHNDGYIYSSSDEGGDDEKSRAEQQAWMDQEMERRRAEEEISKNAPCIRLIERPANRLHIVTILGARIGFGPRVDIQMEDERNLGEECEEPPLLLSIDYSAAQGEETKQRPVEEVGYRLEVVGRPAADGQHFPAVELNGQEMEPNTKYSLRHEDLFRISNVEFAVHIHNGLNTCQGCEPGLFVSEAQNQPIKKKFSKHVERRRQMRALKAQYGLLGEDDDEKEDQQRGVELRQKYVDRARKRRMAVGSVGPVTAVQSVNAAGGIYRQCAAAPVAGCSTDSVELKTAAAGKGNEFGGQKAIAESNKGFKLLQGMGWKSGQGLGKNSQGIQKPIETLVKNDRIGLGMESTSGRPKLVIQMSGGRQELLELTKRRYQQIESKVEQQEREEEKRKKK